jgi:hypothetical protein
VDGRAGVALRPEADSALLRARADRPFEEVSREVPVVRAEVERMIADPVAGT